ncbi:MAG: hypothetical protein WC787_05330 [Patescibacteria group bacterium]|jgi:hypothetical protein
MKRLLSVFLAASTALAALSPLAVHAAASNGALIKGSTSTSVYYLDGGKRYAFPNERVFFSWYGDFSGVVTVPDTELASYQLAGNVTYRPGVKLVKITTDPKVYAVSRYGVLRWVTSENLASLLYGQNWNTKVDDVADTFFTNYLIGTSVEPGNAFQVAEELTAATAISANIRPVGYVPPGVTPTPSPSPTPTSETLFVTISSSQATLNQMLLVFASIQNTPSAITKIEIYNDLQTSPLVTCLASTSCSLSYTVSQSPIQTRFRAVAFDGTGKRYETEYGNQAALTVSAVSSDIQMSVQPLGVGVGSRAAFTSNAQAFPDRTSHKVYAHIPGEPNPVLWKDCGIQEACTGSTPFYRTTQLYSKVTVGGQAYVSASVTVTVSGGEPPKPVLTLLSKPQSNQAILKLDAPSGETMGWSTIVEGTDPDNNAIALCEYSSCEITVQFSKTTTYTGFTDVGGKLEGSNSITVSP